MQLPNGFTLQNGKYKILSTLGQGGFGITYKATMVTEIGGSLGKKQIPVQVAIKEFFFKDYCIRETDTYLVKIPSTTGREMFQRFREKLIKEAHILSSFQHPHIINVFDVFQENDTAYIVMEFIEGESLNSILEKEKILPEERVTKYANFILSAVKEIHNQGFS